jgi:hypothetical protein
LANAQEFFDIFGTKLVVGTDYRLLDIVVDVYHDEQAGITYVLAISEIPPQVSGKSLYRVGTGTPPTAGIGTPLRCIATFLGYTEDRLPKFEYVEEKW